MDPPCLNGAEADDVIRESLSMLNAEFSEKSAANSPVLPVLNIPSDCATGGPMFDKTPAPGPDIIAPRGGLSDVPVFDSTPVQQGKTDQYNENVVSASISEHTPQLQDTPSQSVDGTEEVTQEHNVQAQIDKYNEEHRARVDEHNEKLKMYYRKYPSRRKGTNAVSPVAIDPHIEDQNAVSQRVQKVRVCVAKRKTTCEQTDESPLGSIRRRSPRFAKSLDKDTSEPDPAPHVKRASKRHVVFDEAYAPADADPVGDDSSFCTVKEATTRKRARVGACVKKTGNKRKAVAPSKSEGSDSDEDSDDVPIGKKKEKTTVTKRRKLRKTVEESDDVGPGRFQQTVRCSIGEVLEAVKLLKDPHKAKVREAGFGCVFDWVLDGNVSRPLQCVLLMRMDTNTMKIDCGPGKVVAIARESVRHIFGLPMGGETVPRPSDSGHDAALAKLKAELGFESNASIETKHLRDLLAKLVEDETKVDTAVTVFFSILFTKLICPGSAVRLGREAAMLVNMDYKKMARSDFCQLVVDELKRSAEKYQNTDIPQAGPEGCVLVPLVQYLDCCLPKKNAIMHRKTPRVNFLDKKMLKSIYMEDRIKNGRNDLSKYKIGKLPWKGRNDIVYSYVFPVEELRIEPSLPSPGCPPEVPDVNPEFRANSHAADPCVAPPLFLDIHVAATSGTVIGDIGYLLNKVVERSRSLPSVDERISRISGLFPPGHLPHSDVLKKMTESDDRVLDHLRSAVVFIAKGFVELGAKQDLLCKQYEAEAVIKERQFRAEDADVARGGFGSSSGLGQRESDAEEEAILAEEAAKYDDGDYQDKDFDYVHDVGVGLQFHRDMPSVSPPRDDSDVDSGGDGPYVFTGAVQGDFIPSSQFGEHRFAEGADVVLTGDNNIYVSESLRHDASFIATAAGGLPKQGCVDAGRLCASGVEHISIPSVAPVPDIEDASVVGNKGGAALAGSAETEIPVVNGLDQQVVLEAEIVGPVSGSVVLPNQAEAPLHVQQEATIVPPTTATAEPDVVSKQAGDEIHTSGVSARDTGQDDAPELGGHACTSTEYIEPSFQCTPRASQIPALRRLKDVYHAVCRLRKDPIKKNNILFSNEHCECTIGQVGTAFRPTGMLCSLVVSVGTFLLGRKYRNSEKLVVPYICSRHIFEGQVTTRRVTELFSLDAEERLDQKEVILFATFDPPDPPVEGNVGHFCVVGVNLKKKRFELLDSLRGDNDPDAQRVFFTMASRIKKLWREATNSKGDSFHPRSIDDFEMHYVRMPKQKNAHDCGFFMFQCLQSWDGENLVIFNQEDMLNIRMTLLYSWLTSREFNIDISSVLGVDAGPGLYLEEDDFALFATQAFTPEVVLVREIDTAKQVSKAKKAVEKLHSNVRKPSKKGVPASRFKGKDAVIALDDDDDDFVSPLPAKVKSNVVVQAVATRLRSSSDDDDFVTQKPRNIQSGKLVLSNKRATILSRKFRDPVEKLMVYQFPQLSKAKSIKSLILSKEYQRMHGQKHLAKFTSPIGDPLEVCGNFMFRLFGRGEMMEAEIMDYLISYWKDDAGMKRMFESGKRVLLGPFTIPYLLDLAPFEFKSDDGKVLPRPPFDLKQAAKTFHNYVRKRENLLNAKLILIPRFHENHHTLYVMNRYTGSFDIFDSRRYMGDTSRSAHHHDRVEIMRRMVLLMKEVYGIEEYNKKNLFNWEAMAEKCNYVETPEQGPNECGFYVLKIACTFDGEKFAVKLKNKDRRVEDWKAEYMYQVMFHQKNEIPQTQWPSDVQDLVLLLGLSTQST